MPTLNLGVSARSHAYLHHHSSCLVSHHQNSNCNWTSRILFWVGNVNSSLQLSCLTSDVRLLCEYCGKAVIADHRCDCCCLRGCGTSGRRDLRCALATSRKQSNLARGKATNKRKRQR